MGAVGVVEMRLGRYAGVTTAVEIKEQVTKRGTNLTEGGKYLRRSPVIRGQAPPRPAPCRLKMTPGEFVVMRLAVCSSAWWLVSSFSTPLHRRRLRWRHVFRATLVVEASLRRP